MDRQTGRTTRQIRKAPKKAIYVWLHSDFKYPLDIARELGRTDLTFVSPYWLTNQNWRGRYMTAIVVDHAARLTPEQLQSLKDAESRVHIDHLHWNRLWRLESDYRPAVCDAVCCYRCHYLGNIGTGWRCDKNRYASVKRSYVCDDFKS